MSTFDPTPPPAPPEDPTALTDSERAELERFRANEAAQRGNPPSTVPSDVPAPEGPTLNAGDLAWDGDKPGLVLAVEEDGTYVVGRFASVERTTATLTDAPPTAEDEAI